jgi:hypothetical protein
VEHKNSLNIKLLRIEMSHVIQSVLFVSLIIDPNVGKVNYNIRWKMETLNVSYKILERSMFVWISHGQPKIWM